MFYRRLYDSRSRAGDANCSSHACTCSQDARSRNPGGLYNTEYPSLSFSFQSVDTSFVESDSGKVSTRYEFQPAVGTHLMRYGGTWIKGRTIHK